MAHLHAGRHNLPHQGRVRKLTATLECNGQSWDVSVLGSGGSRETRERSLRAECYVALLAVAKEQRSQSRVQPWRPRLDGLRAIALFSERAERAGAMRELEG